MKITFSTKIILKNKIETNVGVIFSLDITQNCSTWRLWYNHTCTLQMDTVPYPCALADKTIYKKSPLPLNVYPFFPQQRIYNRFPHSTVSAVRVPVSMSSVRTRLLRTSSSSKWATSESLHSTILKSWNRKSHLPSSLNIWSLRIAVRLNANQR